MIGTKADIAKVLTAGLNGDPMVQPVLRFFAEPACISRLRPS